MDKLSYIDSNIVKLEEKIESFQIKLRDLKTEKIKLIDSKKLKMLKDNDIDEDTLRLALDLLQLQKNTNENNMNVGEQPIKEIFINENN